MGRNASREKISSGFGLAAKRAAAALVLCTVATTVASCKKEAPPELIQPIPQCSQKSLQALQPIIQQPVEIRRQGNLVGPPIPSTVQTDVSEALVSLEYDTGESKKVRAGVLVKAPNGETVIVSVASLLADENNPDREPNLHRIRVIGKYGTSGVEWARQQFQVGGIPSKPQENPERPADVNLFFAKPTNSKIGSVALNLTTPERGAWEASPGHITAGVDTLLLPSIRLNTGTTSYDDPGAVLANLEQKTRSPRPTDLGGPMYQYGRSLSGVTGILSSYGDSFPPGTLKDRYGVTLLSVPQGYVMYTVPSTVIEDALRICGPGVVPTPTP